MASDSGCCFYYSDEKEAMAILIHFCVSRRVWRSSFHYALAFPVRSPYLRSTCFSICSSSFVQGLGFIFRMAGGSLAC
nr:uncharacterized protein LOC104115808 [Nicotiana tomentosiformis]